MQLFDCPIDLLFRDHRRWSDQQVIDWDGNFKEEDGSLFLICSERDVDVAEYRRVLHQAREYRDRVRTALTAS